MMQLIAYSRTLTSRSSVRSMAASRRTTEAPPRPSSRRGRISERPRRPELATLPLQSRPNASPFWIMLLLSFEQRDRRIIDMCSVGQPSLRNTPTGGWNTTCPAATAWPSPTSTKEFLAPQTPCGSSRMQCGPGTGGGKCGSISSGDANSSPLIGGGAVSWPLAMRAQQPATCADCRPWLPESHTQSICTCTNRARPNSTALMTNSFRRRSTP
jgi:hypothetical protein